MTTLELTKVTLKDGTIKFKRFDMDHIFIGFNSEGVVQVGYDLLVLDGQSKKCTLLANLGTNRFSLIQLPVPMHVL